MKAGEPLENDVIPLFGDGEELGLLGAIGFVEEHAWALDVKLVLNFEAPGNSGPSIMFENSGQNGFPIQEFAKAVPYPVSNSLAYTIYKKLPNNTDFSIFKDAGMVGFNFAFIDGVEAYHSPIDRPNNLSRNSL